MSKLDLRSAEEKLDKPNTTDANCSHDAANHSKDASLRKMSARKLSVMGVISLVILVLAMFLPAGLFLSDAGEFSLAKLFAQTASNIKDSAAVFVGSGASGMYSAIISQYIAAFLAGGALGLVGAVFQGAFKNPLASPSTLGVISGCLFGALVYCLFLMPDMIGAGTTSMSEISNSFANLSSIEYIWVAYGKSICALIGGLVVAIVALGVSRLAGSGIAGCVVLVVVGQVFTLVLGTFSSTLRYYFEASGDVLRADLMESAQASAFTMFISLADLAFFALPLVLFMVVLLAMRNQMNVLAFSDDEAKTLGVDVGKFRGIVVLICTLCVGLVVGCCGPIAFVGFISPHVARRIVGPNFSVLMPASLFVGASFLVLVAFLGNQIDIDMDQGLNLISTSIGCLVFLIVAFRGRGGVYAFK